MNIIPNKLGICYEWALIQQWFKPDFCTQGDQK